MLIRPLLREFDPAYIKPSTVTGAAKYLLVPAFQAFTQQQGRARCRYERRLGERRQQRISVLLDLRSPHARRHVQSRRDEDAATQLTQAQCGIDVYA